MPEQEILDRAESRHQFSAGFLLVGVLFFASGLVISGTKFEFSDLVWLFSLVVQMFFGRTISLVFRPEPRRGDLQFLTWFVVSAFLYSAAYQILLLAFSPGITWLLVHGLIAISTLSLEQKRRTWPGILRCSPEEWNRIIQNSISILGGSLCVLGVSAQWAICLPLGAGISAVSWILGRFKSTKAREVSMWIILSIGGFLTLIESFRVAKPSSGYWWVTGNDIQTAMSHAVLLSRFGMWDDNRLVGIPNKYHWSVSGWAGMSNPFSQPEVEVGIFAVLILGIGLFSATYSWVLHILDSRTERSHRNTAFVVTVACAALLEIRWTSQQTVMGLIAFTVCGQEFSRLIQKSVARQREWLLAALLLLSATWSNALTLPFLTVFVFASLIASRISGDKWFARPVTTELFRSVSLFLLLLLAGLIFWRFLFLPSAKTGAFVIDVFSNRDHLLPQLLRIPTGPFIDEMRSVGIYIILEERSIFLTIASVIFFCMNRSLYREVRLIPFLVCAVSCISAGFLLAGPEMDKFRSWGTLFQSVLVAILIITGASRIRGRRGMWTLAVTAGVVGLALSILTLSNGVRFEGLWLRSAVEFVTSAQRIQFLVAGTTSAMLIIAISLILQKNSRRRAAVLLLLVWSIGSLSASLVGQLTASIEEFKRNSLSHSSDPKDQLAPSEIQEVSRWLKFQTSPDAIIASNYFCHDGTRCADALEKEVTPTIWGLSGADMSNLVAYSERRFFVQAFRHIFGNVWMSDVARNRVALTLKFSRDGDAASLIEAGVNYFVLDRQAAPASEDLIKIGRVFRNSRFTVYRLN